MTHTPSLIVRLPNWVGDVIMALPALHALKACGIELSLVGKPWIVELLAACDMSLFPLATGFLAKRNQLATIPTAHTLLLTNSFSSALVAFLANKHVIGYRSDARQALLTSSIKKNSQQHEVEVFWTIAKFAANHWFPSLNYAKSIQPSLHLSLKAQWIQQAKQHLFEVKISSPFIVICPAATGKSKQGELKIWPHWTELAYQLREKTVVVCPGPQEERLCRELLPNAIQLTGLNLSLYAAVLSLSEGVIANDSGPMHLACAVGRPTLGVFGVSSPKRTRPWGGDYIGSEQGWPTVDEVLQRFLSIWTLDK